MTPDERPTKLSFAQGLMLFFVQRIIDEHTMSTFFGDDNLNNLLMEWSTIVREGRDNDQNFPCSIKIPEDFGKKQIEPASETEAILNVQGKQVLKRIKKVALDLSFIEEKYRESYRPLLEEPQFFPLISLLADNDLGQLMQIEYTAELAELATITAPAPKAEGKDADIIREAIARSRGKKPDQLTNEDYDKTTKLNLYGTQVSNIEPLKGLSNLLWLNLTGTQVSNIESLRELSNLQELSLTGTQVSNIEPLKGLSNLQKLWLSGTQVSNIEPLKGLLSLQKIDLTSTQVSNIEPLKGLQKLQTLYLTSTQVSNIEPLKGLSNLQILSLFGTRVSNIEPIKGLLNLQALNLTDCKNLSNIEPLKGLSQLETLTLRGTLVSNIEPLKELSNLQGLWLSGTKVSKEQESALKKALPKLTIYH